MTSPKPEGVRNEPVGASKVDATLVERYVRLLGVGKSAHEVRVIFAPAGGPRRILSGVFDASGKIARGVEPWGTKAHCLITLNPVQGTARNTLARGEATKDDAIARRAWLLVDIDAERPDGMGDFCATEAELERALCLRDEMAAEIEQAVGATGVRLCSGNGGTILYRLPQVQLQNDAVKRALAALAVRFDRPGAHVDRSVSNLSRLTRIAGTLNVKRAGPDRPRRIATLEYTSPEPPPQPSTSPPWRRSCDHPTGRVATFDLTIPAPLGRSRKGNATRP